MCVYDDFNGVYFTIQAIRTFHREVIDDIEFVIINNNPNSEQGKAVKTFVHSHIKEPFQYLEFTKYTSTTIKTKIFELAETPYVMSVDCHVLIQPGALKKLIDYYDRGLDGGNLLQGPLVHDSLDGVVSTHFNDTWGSGMKGQWAYDERYKSPDSEPFEIHGQGMGLFSCRKDSWLGYNKHFRGFGGEEIYIQDKYKAHGKKTMCLPFLGWVHRFTRIGGVPYPNKWEDRYRNYILGRFELGQPIDDIESNYSKLLSEEVRNRIKSEAYQLTFNEGRILSVVNSNNTNKTISPPNTNTLSEASPAVVIPKELQHLSSLPQAAPSPQTNVIEKKPCGCKKGLPSQEVVQQEQPPVVELVETRQSIQAVDPVVKVAEREAVVIVSEEKAELATPTNNEKQPANTDIKKPCGCKNKPAAG